MEEKTKKFTYEQLQKIAGDLSQQNQLLTQRLQQMQVALENRDFDYTSFFVSMLFKVMEHPEMYSQEFVAWAATQIEDILTSFSKAKDPVEEEKKDETE